MENFDPQQVKISGEALPEALSGIVFADMNFADFVDKAKVGMFLFQDNALKYVNAALASFTGHEPMELIGRPLDEMVLTDNLEALWHRVTITASGAVKSSSFTVQVAHRDGHVVDVEMQGTQVEYRGRHAVFGVAVDVSERLRREREIRESREQLRELTSYINTVQERQRARISREIHDVLGGMLTSIKMDAKRILRRADSSEMIEITEGLIDLVQETIDAAREMSEQLHPGLLEHLGLQAALARQLQLFEKRHNVVCTLLPPEAEIPLEGEQAIAAYRIFQEALTNISRHAEATQVQVSLAVANGLFEMRITDNGCGIDPAYVRDNAMGMLGMKERAREAGGQVLVESSASAGTRLILTMKPAGRERSDELQNRS